MWPAKDGTDVYLAMLQYALGAIGNSRLDWLGLRFDEHRQNTVPASGRADLAAVLDELANLGTLQIRSLANLRPLFAAKVLWSIRHLHITSQTETLLAVFEALASGPVLSQLAGPPTIKYHGAGTTGWGLWRDTGIRSDTVEAAIAGYEARTQCKVAKGIRGSWMASSSVDSGLVDVGTDFSEMIPAIKTALAGSRTWGKRPRIRGRGTGSLARAAGCQCSRFGIVRQRVFGLLCYYLSLNCSESRIIITAWAKNRPWS